MEDEMDPASGIASTSEAPNRGDTPARPLQNGNDHGSGQDDAASTEAAGQELSLPFPATLSHSLFLVEPFHASDFLLSRKHMLLDDLRSELRTYLTSLRAQLVSIINSDYEDFINLGGAHLLGSEDQMAYRMRKPLEGISREIREAREELETVRTALRDKLEKRERVRQSKLTARKLLAVNDQLLKVEDMLLISSPQEASALSPATRKTPALGSSTDGVRRVSASQQQSRKAAGLGQMPSGVASSKVDRSMGSDTKRLERTAQEYNQLLYLVRKSQGHRFVESLQPRIDRISTTIHQDLASLLSSTLTSAHSASNSQSSAAAHRTRIEALTDLFRTYASISQFRLAEEVIRRQMVSDFVVRTIHREALLAPQSPMMPVTPFAGFGSLGSMLAATPNLASPGSSANGGSFPFSLAQQQQQQSSRVLAGSTPSSSEDKNAIPPFYQIDLIHSPSTPAATDTFISDALVDMYNKLLIFISKEIGVILDITERKPAQGTAHAAPGNKEAMASINVGHDGDATVPGSPATRERLHLERNGGSKPGYEILSNVIWAEIAQRLMGECGHLIFSAGRPDTFHRNYTATQAFVSRLENLCPSQKYLQILRNNPQYSAFMKRWQLPVYYQLRFKEIVGSLESILATTIIYQAPSAVQSTPLLLAASEAVYTAIGACWKDDIYLSDLAGRFWKLTLQLLSRYRTWVNASLPDAVRQQLSSAQSLLAASQASQPAPSASAATLQRSASGVNLQRLLPSALSAAAGSGSRPGTPQPSSSSSPASDDQSDEDALRKLSIIIHDAIKLVELVDRLFQEVITPKLPKISAGSLRPAEGDEAMPDAAMSASLASITTLAAPLLWQLVGILSKRCSEPLRLVRSGASQVRAAPRSTKSHTQAEPSYFVPNILRPGRTFLDGAGKVLPRGERQALVQSLLEDLASKYEAALSKMKKDGDALRRLKKGRQGTGFSSLFGRGNASAAAGGDDATGPNAEDERVKEQMSVDVEAFANEAESLGADLSASESLAALRAVVADWTK